MIVCRTLVLAGFDDDNGVSPESSKSYIFVLISFTISVVFFTQILLSAVQQLSAATASNSELQCTSKALLLALKLSRGMCFAKPKLVSNYAFAKLENSKMINLCTS